MDECAEDALHMARERLDRIEARQRELKTQLAAMPTTAGIPEKTSDAETEKVIALARVLERERTEAYNAVGRALLAKFERDMCALRVQMPNRAAAMNLALRAADLHSACLAILTQWPDLRDEAQRRLHPPTVSDLFTLHG